MIEKYEHAKTTIYVIADIHGNFDILYNKINENLSDCILIIAGDIGLGFYSYQYYQKAFENINNLLIQKHIYCYLIRGNHDDPSYFKEHKINFSNVKTIDDYSIISVGNENILCIGGAISIDRMYRIKKDLTTFNNNKILMSQYNPNITDEEVNEKTLKSYWINENLYYDENKLKEIDVDVNYVITHTSPNFVWKQGTNEISYWINNDERLEDDLRQERENMGKVYHKLIECNREPKKWVYGHFHDHNVETYQNTEFIALINCDYSFDCFELK